MIPIIENRLCSIISAFILLGIFTVKGFFFFNHVCKKELSLLGADLAFPVPAHHLGTHIFFPSISLGREGFYKVWGVHLCVQHPTHYVLEELASCLALTSSTISYWSSSLTDLPSYMKTNAFLFFKSLNKIKKEAGCVMSADER